MAVWAELIRLRRPLLYWSCAAALALSALFVVQFLIGASRNLKNAASELSLLESGPSPKVCEYVGARVGTPCQTRLTRDIRVAREYSAQLQEIYVLRGAMSSTLGAGGLAAGFSASLPGAVAMTLLAAGHVGGEWARGPARQRFSRDPRRSDFILGKFVSLFLAGVVVLGAVFVGLAVLAPLAARATRMPPSQPAFDPIAFTMGQVPRAILVISVFSALGTAMGVLVRRPLGVVGALGLLFGLAIVAGFSPDSYEWSMAIWIARVMRFTQTNMLADHVWIDQIPGPLPLARAVLGLGFVVTVCFSLAYVRLSREPLDQ